MKQMKHNSAPTEADCCNQRQDANDDHIDLALSFRRADYLYMYYTCDLLKWKYIDVIKKI